MPEGADVDLDTVDLDDVDVSDPAESGEAGSETTESDPFSEFGGRETVQAAYQLHQQTQNEEGVIDLFIQTAKALGLGDREIEALFADQQQQKQTTTEEDDPDRLVTARELREWMTQQQQTAQQQVEQQAVAHAQATVNATLKALGVNPESDDKAERERAEAILRFGDPYLTKGDYDPSHVEAAVRKGWDAYERAVEAGARAYVARKKAARDSTPKAPAGGSSGGSTISSPKDLNEAIKRVREKLNAS